MQYIVLLIISDYLICKRKGSEEVAGEEEQTPCIEKTQDEMELKEGIKCIFCNIELGKFSAIFEETTKYIEFLLYSDTYLDILTYN